MEILEQGGEERLQVFGAPTLQFASAATLLEWGGEIKVVFSVWQARYDD